MPIELTTQPLKVLTISAQSPSYPTSHTSELLLLFEAAVEPNVCGYTPLDAEPVVGAPYIASKIQGLLNTNPIDKLPDCFQ